MRSSLYLLQTYVSSAGVWYGVMLGAIAIAVALFLPRGLWGTVQERFNLRLLPVGYRVEGALVNVTAAVVESKGAPFVLRELSLGELRPDEVLVEVAASGICHTDLTCRNQLIPTPLPAVLGHEGAGVVARVGEAVTKVAPGDRVGMTFTACGECPSCRCTKSAYCHLGSSSTTSPRLVGSTGRASFRATSRLAGTSSGSRASPRTPSRRSATSSSSRTGSRSRSPRRSAAGSRPGRARCSTVLRRAGRQQPRRLRRGLVGLAAVLAGVVAGCSPIVAVDIVPERLALARELGAMHTVDAREEDAVERVREATGGGVDFAIEASGSPHVLRWCVDSTAPRGVTGVIGAPSVRRPRSSLDVTTLLTGGRVVRGVVEGDCVPDEFLPYLYSLYTARPLPGRPFDDLLRVRPDRAGGARRRVRQRHQGRAVHVGGERSVR